MAKKTIKNKVKKNDKLVCGECGLAVCVDEVCSCTEFCDVFCCGKPMNKKK